MTQRDLIGYGEDRPVITWPNGAAVGMNLYVVQGVRGHGSVSDLIYGVTPFILMLFLMICLSILYPGLVTWLPSLLYQ